MGLKALSEATGLPAGSIYHHFPGGKDEIAAIAIVETAEAVAQLLESLLAEGVTDAAVGRMFAFMADRLEATDFVAGCVVGTPALDYLIGPPGPRRLRVELRAPARADRGRLRPRRPVPRRRPGDGHDAAERLRGGHGPGPGPTVS